MSTREKRTARRFQVEALETRWTPGAGTGIGGDLLMAHVDPPHVHVAPVPCGSKPGVSPGIGTNAVAVPYGSKLGIGSGSNAHVVPLGGKGGMRGIRPRVLLRRRGRDRRGCLIPGA